MTFSAFTCPASAMLGIRNVRQKVKATNFFNTMYRTLFAASDQSKSASGRDERSS